jgi:hypothetical protein
MRREMRSNEVRQQFGASISEATLRPNFWGSKIHEKRCDEANVRDVAIKDRYLLKSRDSVVVESMMHFFPSNSLDR